MSKKVVVKNPNRLIVTVFILILLIISVIFFIQNLKKSKEVSQIEIFKNQLTENSIKEEEQNIQEQENTIAEISNDIKDNNNTQNEINENTISKDNNQTNRLKAQSTQKYYIMVNVQENVVNIYEKDSNGQYTIPVKAMLCSTGTATPEAGEIFTMPNDKWNRYPWGTMVGGVYAQYYSRINGNILFHSVPYTKEKKSALEYEEYDKLGTKASAGCIRLTVINAKWIYDNCPPGTIVEFYASSNPGPLRKTNRKKDFGCIPRIKMLGSNRPR